MMRGRLSLAAAILFVLAVVACGGIETGYFESRVNEATQDMVARRYGTPHRIQKLPEGRSLWIYFERGSGTASFAGTATSDYCRAYLLTFDDQDILRDWKQQDCRG